MFAGIYTSTWAGTCIRVGAGAGASDNISHIDDRQSVLSHPDSLENWHEPRRSSKDVKGQI